MLRWRQKTTQYWPEKLAEVKGKLIAGTLKKKSVTHRGEKYTINGPTDEATFTDWLQKGVIHAFFCKPVI